MLVIRADEDSRTRDKSAEVRDVEKSAVPAWGGAVPNALPRRAQKAVFLGPEGEEKLHARPAVGADAECPTTALR